MSDEKTKFEEFEQGFAAVPLLAGAKCVKISVSFENAEGDIVTIGLIREGCSDPDERPPEEDHD